MAKPKPPAGKTPAKKPAKPAKPKPIAPDTTAMEVIAGLNEGYAKSGANYNRVRADLKRDQTTQNTQQKERSKQTLAGQLNDYASRGMTGGNVYVGAKAFSQKALANEQKSLDDKFTSGNQAAIDARRADIAAYRRAKANALQGAANRRALNAAKVN
jgi:hypothetical protein